MAAPLHVSAAILPVVTASVTSVRSLQQTVERYRGQDETLRRLLDQLNDFDDILDSVQKVSQVEASMLALLEDPLERWQQLCQAFEEVMKDFAEKASTGFRDWVKLELMKGGIEEFIITLSGYKSTISIGLATIALQTSKTTPNVLEQYSDMVQDTTYNLNMQLQRINEKIERFPSEESNTVGSDFRDDSTGIRHCIHICEEAITCIGSLADRERRLHSTALSKLATEHTKRDWASVDQSSSGSGAWLLVNST